MMILTSRCRHKFNRLVLTDSQPGVGYQRSDGCADDDGNDDDDDVAAHFQLAPSASPSASAASWSFPHVVYELATLSSHAEPKTETQSGARGKTGPRGTGM